jgi:hypothetical protein
LSKYGFEKLFTPEEANELLPALIAVVRDMQMAASELRSRIHELVKSDPEIESMRLEPIIERYPELRSSAERMAELAQKVESYGCYLKDIDLGLVDFPCEIEEDQVVFLCWQFGEPAVVAWHTIEGGFGQRKTLPGTAKSYLN